MKKMIKPMEISTIMISFKIQFILTSHIPILTRVTSTNILSNIGLVFFVIVGMIIFSALLVLLRLLLKKSERARKLFDSIKKKIFWNAFLRALMKGYLNFAIALFISMQAVSDDVMSMIVSVIMAFVIFTSPMIVFYWLSKYTN